MTSLQRACPVCGRPVYIPQSVSERAGKATSSGLSESAGEMEGASLHLFPFCSRQCKMIDLGKWLEGDYVIPGDPAMDEFSGEEGQ
jgi:endogenous inhibitor of DNA gyrase (YacG/DUF329 family)